MNFHILTIFPEIINDGVNHSILKRAIENNYISVNAVNIRDFSKNKHKKVDDYPYGGGAGMVMTPQPIYDAYLSVKENLKSKSSQKSQTKVVYMTPQGKVFNQNTAQSFSEEEDLIILCGHYEGIDERVIEEIVTDEVSIGDFILTGGELPALVMIDSISRLISGVLGSEESFIDESFHDNLLEYPQYTRPPEFLGREVPEVLLSGHHKKIEEWRYSQKLKKTSEKRPDLLL